MADLEVNSIADSAGTDGPSFPLGLYLTSKAGTDYEEGVFTPVLEGATTAGTATYSIKNGKFTRIGNVVFISIYLLYSGHTGTGAAQITGLPFTSASSPSVRQSITIGGGFGATVNAYDYFTARIISGSAYCDFIRASGSSTSTVAITDLTDANMQINGHYFI